jgi:two-component system cell cycle response regulator
MDTRKPPAAVRDCAGWRFVRVLSCRYRVGTSQPESYHPVCILIPDKLQADASPLCGMPSSTRIESAIIDDGSKDGAGDVDIETGQACMDPEAEMIDKPEEKQRLLIVDDSKVIRVTARKILREHFEIIEAVDGENAWDVLNRDHAISLVVSDLTMPKLDGFGLLKRIRGSLLPHLRELPVIIITGANDTEATMNEARQAGATDFIGKPFDAVHLLARTQAHANSHAVTNTLIKKNAALEERSTVDALTGCANEAAFMERSYQQLSYAIRHNQSLALFRIEIDRYDAIYRQYGKSFSESIILTLAKLLGAAIRQEDTVARIGTARFAMLMAGLDKAGIHNLAERISSGIGSRLFKSGNDQAAVTVSIGVASPQIRRDMRVQELIAAADERLSFAISNGGNQVIYDVPVAKRSTSRPAHATPSGSATENPAKVVFLDTKTSTSADNADPLHGEDMEVEEIEIFSTGFPYNHFSVSGNKPAEETGRHRPSAETNGVFAEETVVPATAARQEKRSAPRHVPAAALAAVDLTLETIPAAETGTPPGADDGTSTGVPASLNAEGAPQRSGDIQAAVRTQTLQAKNRHGTIKAQRRSRRPGVLRRTLAWLGLMRSRG